MRSEWIQVWPKKFHTSILITDKEPSVIKQFDNKQQNIPVQQISEHYNVPTKLYMRLVNVKSSKKAER